ncbi:DoxX family protein [Chitinophaga sp.]|uniref:DoxX family protein n=1 Tax=Chitinophaga sp. TaxID=1869181 RepID=UPI002F91E524
METQTIYMNTAAPSKSTRITGWVITIICILFLLVDAVMKIASAAVSVKGSTDLGWPESQVQGLGVVLLLCTILYAIPRTAVLGAIFLSCYLGGAVAIMTRVNIPYYFPIVFGVLVWVGVYLRFPALRSVFPLSK